MRSGRPVPCKYSNSTSQSACSAIVSDAHYDLGKLVEPAALVCATNFDRPLRSRACPTIRSTPGIPCTHRPGPREVVTKVHSEVVSSLKSPDIVDRLRTLNAEHAAVLLSRSPPGRKTPSAPAAEHRVQCSRMSGRRPPR